MLWCWIRGSEILHNRDTITQATWTYPASATPSIGVLGLPSRSRQPDTINKMSCDSFWKGDAGPNLPPGRHTRALAGDQKTRHRLRRALPTSAFKTVSSGLFFYPFETDEPAEKRPDGWLSLRYQLNSGVSSRDSNSTQYVRSPLTSHFMQRQA